MTTILPVMHWFWVATISNPCLSAVVTSRRTWREFRPGRVVSVDWTRVSVAEDLFEISAQSSTVSSAVCRSRMGANPRTIFSSIPTGLRTNTELAPARVPAINRTCVVVACIPIPHRFTRNFLATFSSIFGRRIIAFPCPKASTSCACVSTARIWRPFSPGSVHWTREIVAYSNLVIWAES